LLYKMAMTRIKSEKEIDGMRESGRMLATVLDVVEDSIATGIKTNEIARIAKKELKKLGGKPAFYGYSGFPDVICISVNDEIVHGIPSDRVLESGDLVGLDFGVSFDGMITDAARTIIVGRGADPQKLVETTEQALYAGIDAVKDGVAVGDIGAAVSEVLASKGFGIVRDLVGHGVGHELHEDPNIPNYGTRGTGIKLQAGMTIAIEPMATLGTSDVVIARDGWTVKTKDGSLASHAEHTVLILDDGYEILTALPDNKG
jgi:methionyl aminopeptidase